MTLSGPPNNTASLEDRGERALLVHVRSPGETGDEEAEEFRRLAQSAGATIGAIVTATPRHPDSATYLGQGKVAEVKAALAGDPGMRLVLVNHDLSPAQERNLEREWSARVLDRTGLILAIFAERARSHEGKLQVELAQLEHLSTRLVRGWTHLERQKGGIGLRGPGETQLETDRRLIGERIKALSRALKRVRAQRGQRRRARDRVPIATVSLVGYTNAGKSSLFNALTGAQAYAANRLFATLDPTMRRLSLPGKVDAIVADTVGFVRRLPHGLIEAFRATLEEIAEADLLLHVIDASDPERRETMEQVDAVLAEIGAAQIPRILVFNKIDRTGESGRVDRDETGRVIRVSVSAVTGAGLDGLREALSAHLRADRRPARVTLGPMDSRLRAQVYDRLEVISEEVRPDGSQVLALSVNPADGGWLASRAGEAFGWLPDALAPAPPPAPGPAVQSPQVAPQGCDPAPPDTVKTLV